MSARSNVNIKSSADSSSLTATQRHSKLQSRVRALRRDRDEGQRRIGSGGEGEESGMQEQFCGGKLLMNAQGPSLNSCIINIAGNKLEFNLASWKTKKKAIFKLQADDFVRTESPGWNEREGERENTDSRHLFLWRLPVKFRDPNRP